MTEYLLIDGDASSTYPTEDDAKAAARAAGPGTYGLAKIDRTDGTYTVLDPAALTAAFLGGGKASLAWPADWQIVEVGRDGSDTKGRGEWSGVPTSNPFVFGLLIPGVTYALHAVAADGQRVATSLKAGEPPAPVVTPDEPRTQEPAQPIEIGYEFPEKRNVPSKVALRLVRLKNALSVYWKAETGSSDRLSLVAYRKKGTTAWRAAIWGEWDGRGTSGTHPTTPARAREYRSMIRGLEPSTTYEVQCRVWGSGETSEIAEVTTWFDTPPIAKTIDVDASRLSTFVVPEGGTAEGYVRYRFSGELKTAKRADFNVDVPVPFVELVGLKGTGARKHAVQYRMPAPKDNDLPVVILRGADLSDFGSVSPKNKRFGRNCDSAIGTLNSSTYYVPPTMTIDCDFHDPSFDCNHWDESNGTNMHPEGPQGMTFYRSAQGQHHIERVRIWSKNGNFFNDGIGSETGNYGFEGFPFADSHILACTITQCCDDAMELEGAGCCILAEDIYTDEVYNPMASATCSVGPVYYVGIVCKRTLWGHSDTRARGVALKHRQTAQYGGGLVYVIHCTMDLDSVQHGFRSDGFDGCLRVYNSIVPARSQFSNETDDLRNRIRGNLIKGTTDMPAAEKKLNTEGEPKFRPGGGYWLADDSPRADCVDLPNMGKTRSAGAVECGAWQNGEREPVYG